MSTSNPFKLTLALWMLGGCALGAQAAAIQITFGGAAAGDGSGLTTAIAGATVYNFDGPLPAQYSGAGGVVTGSTGTYAAPAGDTTRYLSVALNSPSGSELASFGQAYNYFGLYWGSIDTYNSLSFIRNGTTLATLTGSDVIAAGAQFGDRFAAGSNRYVNFSLSGGTFDAVLLSSTNYAFESDNHAVALVPVHVPVPGTLSLVSLGLAAIGLARRKVKQLPGA
jgi:hypothetical protein